MKRKGECNIGVIGVGASGLQHIHEFRLHPAATVVAVADISSTRVREAAERFGIQDMTGDYRALLGRTEIDAVSIAVPNHLHVPIAIDALRAGKHVLLEKPMATSVKDATRLVAEARKSGLLLMLGQNIRFSAEVQTAKALVDSNVLGQVYHLKTTWMRRAGIPRIGSWFTQRKFAGGGCMYDIGVHALDRCLFVLGEFAASHVSAASFAQFGPRGEGNWTWGKSEIDPRRPFDVEDLAVALIRYKCGCTVLLETSWAAHQQIAESNYTQLFGTKAGLLFPPLQLCYKTRRGYSVENVLPKTLSVSTNRMVHFVDCLLGRADPYVKIEESLAVQKIMDAIYLSAKIGAEVIVD